MKKYMKSLMALAIAISMTTCNLEPELTDYRNEQRHKEMVNDPVLNTKLAKAALANTYSVFQDSWSSHDDAGLRAFQMATDMMCEDMLLASSTWFIYDYQLDNREANYRRTNSTWKMFYKIIANMNLHLETYFKESSTDADYIASKAEAQAIRGIAYFHLVNFYQHTYKGHEDKPGVPLILTSEGTKLPRAKVSEVYAQIIKDLTPCAENGYETNDHTDVDKFVAAAYLAKVYAQMEDWENMLKYARIAKDGGTDLISVPGRSWAVGQPDILWGYDVNTTTSTLWTCFWSHMDQYLGRGYAAGGGKKLIHNLLYEKIPQNDSRKKLWIDPVAFPDIANRLKAKALNGSLAMDSCDQAKFIAGEEGFDQDLCFIRVQDPMLLEIEALIELNQLGEATSLLNDFVKKRNVDFVAPTTQEELRAEIRFQRRIELWGEGTNWLDMKRWKLPIDRTNPRTNHTVTFKNLIRTDEPRFYHMLPRSEMDANDKLVQNDPV